jgi:hypothetical protein
MVGKDSRTADNTIHENLKSEKEFIKTKKILSKIRKS